MYSINYTVFIKSLLISNRVLHQDNIYGICTTNKLNVKFNLYEKHLSSCLDYIKQLKELKCPICRTVSYTLIIV